MISADVEHGCVQKTEKAGAETRGGRRTPLSASHPCRRADSKRLPASPEAVASYIAECAGRLKVGSIQRRLNAISAAHKAMGLDSPIRSAIVTNTMKGIRRTLGTAQDQKAPALTDDFRAMVDAADNGAIGLRDRALVLLGFAGAFRRSELVGLDTEDCAFDKDGLTVTLHRSKTDQEGAGRKIGIPYGSNPETCPVRVLQAWIDQTGIADGPLLRSITRHGQVQMGRLAPIDVARVVKKLAIRAGLDPTKYAGHSLRAGHATSAAIAGASERSIMNQTGHRSVEMVRRYIREGSLFRENSAGKLGLYRRVDRYGFCGVQVRNSRSRRAKAKHPFSKRTTDPRTMSFSGTCPSSFTGQSTSASTFVPRTRIWPSTNKMP